MISVAFDMVFFISLFMILGTSFSATTFSISIFCFSFQILLYLPDMKIFSYMVIVSFHVVFV